MLSGQSIPISLIAPDLALSNLKLLDRHHVVYTEKDKINEGNFGIVYKAKWTPPLLRASTTSSPALSPPSSSTASELVAVKVLKVSSSEGGLAAFSEFRHEVTLMSYEAPLDPPYPSQPQI